MPRKKRHDPDDAPIDGDYRNDHVVNQKAGIRYYLLNEEDAAVKQAQGATLEERGPDAARPFYARGSDSDSGYTVRGLTLYKMPEELARKYDARVTTEAAQRMSVIRQEARTSPGGEYSETAV